MQDDYSVDDDIVCPFCKHKQDLEITYGHTTMHGTEDDPLEQDCESCDKTFYVKEYVSRSWSTFKSLADTHNLI